ncbi:MAG: hypothetical protein CL928_03795 [Deltaproteobacteria bacterium]|nr:hypothetical protein [Deltaproteobacteria bacterium]
MEWTEPDQLAAKVRWVESLLQRDVDQATPSPRSLGYRARIALKTDEQGRLGYHRPRSHEWLAVPECAIARPELNQALDALPTLPGIPTVSLRTDGHRVVLAASLRRRRARRPDKRAVERASQVLGALDLSATSLSGVALDGRPVGGDCTLRLSVGGIEHHLGPESFFQVNLEANELLVERVVQQVLARSPQTVLDLYSGAGNLSFPIAKQGVDVVQVEVEGSSVSDARSTAKRLGIPVTIQARDVGRLEAGEIFFDVVILDPPRAGAPGVLEELLLTRPRALVYVSCNPETLARDLGPARSQGYAIRHLEVFDMFPQTSHVETLCVLERA